MKKLFKKLFGKDKDGYCRFWWHHEYGEAVFYEEFIGTGQYVGGQEIRKKIKHLRYTCKICGDKIIH